MLVSAVSPATAPQTTGHPAGLPPSAPKEQPDVRVTAAKSGGRATDARTDHSSSRNTARKPAALSQDGRLRADGNAPAEGESAPPTILQIKINSMLAEQKAKLTEEKQEADADQTDAVSGVSGTPEQATTEAETSPSSDLQGPTQAQDTAKAVEMPGTYSRPVHVATNRNTPGGEAPATTPDPAGDPVAPLFNSAAVAPQPDHDALGA